MCKNSCKLGEKQFVFWCEPPSQGFCNGLTQSFYTLIHSTLFIVAKRKTETLVLTALKLWRIIKRAITRSRSLQGCFQLGGKQEPVTPVWTTTTQNLKHGSSILKICSEKIWVGGNPHQSESGLIPKGRILTTVSFSFSLCFFCIFHN